MARYWYRRLTRTEEGEFATLPAYTRGIYAMMLRYADDEGRFPLGARSPEDAIGKRIGADPGERRRLKQDIPRLVQVGVLRMDPGAVVVVEIANGSTFVTEGRWSKAAYQKVRTRDAGLCRYCGSDVNIEIDHVVPRRLGGGDSAANLVVACRKCNRRKRGRTPEQAGMSLRPAPIPASAKEHH